MEKITESEYSLQSESGSVDGVAFKDIILFPVTSFLHRIHQLIDIIETMKQLYHLITTTKTLPLLVAKETSAKPFIQNSENEDEDSCFEEEPSNYELFSMND